MNIYVYLIALGMIIICLSYYCWVDKRERKLEEGKRENDKQKPKE